MKRRGNNEKNVYILINNICTRQTRNSVTNNRSDAIDTMLEKDIVSAILRYLKTVPQCFSWKTHGGQYGTAGLPDIIVCYRGRFAAFEVKMPSGKLTKLQEATLQRINAAKGHAYKVTSLQEVKEILQNIDFSEDSHGK